MNGDSNNTKQFRCNSFFIRLGDKAVFLALALGIISLLSACISIPNPNEPPVRLSGLSYQDTNDTAYIWTSGTTVDESFFGEVDGSIGVDYYYATITKIDDINVPDEYLPRVGKLPYWTWLLEIPVGKHTVEILHKEYHLLGAHEKSRQTLTFMARPGQEYHPFTSVSCSKVFSCGACKYKEYFWIEQRHIPSTYRNDDGAGYEGETVQWIGLHELNMTKTSVFSTLYSAAAGERPYLKPCE